MAAAHTLKEGELVYIPSRGELHEGKVLRREPRAGQQGYTVRFLGGRAARESPHEEWFPAPAVQSQSAAEERVARRAGSSALGMRGPGRRQRGAELKVSLPEGLRWQLVNDWEQVCRRKAGVPLPRHPAVIDVLYSFREASRDAEGHTQSELVNSLQEYFDESIFTLLMYEGEAEMYNTARVNMNNAPSTYFGAEHLLRLVVKLPDILAATDATDHRMGIIQSQLYDFVSFLSRNQASFFQFQYSLPSKET